MKPLWNNAPRWANWLAMDENGCWSWYQYEPEQANGYWYTPTGYDEPAASDSSWNETKEERP